MKNTKKLGVIAAAMVVASQIGLLTAAAEPTVEDARTIAQLIDTGEYFALRDYIIANPEVLEGNSALASILNQFMREMNTIDDLGVVRLQASTVAQVLQEAAIY